MCKYWGKDFLCSLYKCSSCLALVDADRNVSRAHEGSARDRHDAAGKASGAPMCAHWCWGLDQRERKKVGKRQIE